MRAIRLPAAVAVCAEPNSHYVVTAVNSSASVQAFTQANIAKRKGNASPVPRLRLDGLLPADWAALLHTCRALSHPQKAYNFSSPGDMSAAATEQKSSPAGNPSAALDNVDNGAYMHIVERSPGDFVPNNMVYHQLQRYTLHGASAGVEGFASLVRAAQAQGPQSAEEAARAVGAAAVVSAAQKAALDPLASSEDALAKSAANERIDPWFVAPEAHAKPADSSPNTPPSTFTFYPFPCPVAASIPYRSQHFCVMVNLKPIVPHHLMVVPLRCVSTIHALTAAEVEDWGRTVVLTMRVLNQVRGCEDGNYSVAIQQGELAGQTVPHLHTHIIPFDPAGKLAGEPESEEGEQRSRPPRTVATMQEETERFKPIFRKLEKTL